jgi:hypothetical protein
MPEWPAFKKAIRQRICHARTHNEMIGICDSITLILRKMKSKPRKSNNGNLKHAETLGGKSTLSGNFQPR